MKILAEIRSKLGNCFAVMQYEKHADVYSIFV